MTKICKCRHHGALAPKYRLLWKNPPWWYFHVLFQWRSHCSRLASLKGCSSKVVGGWVSGDSIEIQYSIRSRLKYQDILRSVDNAWWIDSVSIPFENSNGSPLGESRWCCIKTTPSALEAFMWKKKSDPGCIYAPTKGWESTCFYLNQCYRFYNKQLRAS